MFETLGSNIKSLVIKSIPWILIFILLSTAIRPAEKYAGGALTWLAYSLAALGLLTLLLRSERFQNFATTHMFVYGVAVSLALISALFYPAADALKERLQGQDQDDCTILVIEQIFRLDYPYDQTSYFGNPCSPLFGALVPYMPFVAIGAYGLANSFIVILSVYLAYKLTGSGSLPVSIAMLITFGIPQTLELMVNGSDFIFMGFGLLTLALLMAKSREDARVLYPATVLAAMLSSTRVSMPILLAGYLVWLFLEKRRHLPVHGVILVSLAFGPSLLIYLISPTEFSPLHLVGKGQTLVPGVFYLAMILATLIGLMLVVYSSTLRSDPAGLLVVVLSPHLLFLSFGDLVFNRELDFFWWEGASYLMVLTPLFAYVAARSLILNSPFKNGMTYPRDNLV